MNRSLAALHEALATESALAAFSVYNLEQAQAICRAAQAEDRPVIMQAGASAFAYAGREALAALAVATAAGATVPVGVHLDHSREYEEILACLDLGYTSVMFDGSALPYEDNVAQTRQVVAVAHARGAWVEAELAGIPGDEDRSGDAAVGALTDPDVAADFVARTDVDALAVAIGNVHGIPRQPVVLDLERLARIRERATVPLVLHGASGLEDAAVRASIALGVAKVNVNTELRRALRDGLRSDATQHGDADDLPSLLGPATAAVERVARQKIRLYGATEQRHPQPEEPA